MELPGLNFQPGRVVEAEVRQKFGSPVCLDTSSPSPRFHLVLSFGRCKFRLSEENAAIILQSVIGGYACAFRLYTLSDRVFRFSVSSPVVGFHIYKLRAFEVLSLSSSSTFGIMVVRTISLNFTVGKLSKLPNGPLSLIDLPRQRLRCR